MREQEIPLYSRGGNRRERTILHWRKDTLEWNAKERNARKREEERESNQHRSDEGSRGCERRGMEDEGGGKASD